MSTVAIDNARTSERLSVFLSEIENESPTDVYFQRRPALDKLLKNCKKQDGGRQLVVNVNVGDNDTIQDFGGYDKFNTNPSDTARVAVYPMVNKGGSIVISWEEEREVAGNNHATFDLVKHRRKIAMESLMDSVLTDIFAPTQVASKVSAMIPSFLATGSLGELDAATYPTWAGVNVGSGSFASQGLSDMRSLYNQLVDQGANPDTIITNRTVYEYYEKEVDPDVRYSIMQGNKDGMTLSRGANSLLFKQIPLIYDPKAPTGYLFMYDSDNFYFKIDSAADFAVDPFASPIDQKAYVALMYMRGNLVSDKRDALGFMDSIVA